LEQREKKQVLKIGGVTLNSRLLLAPMAGYTDIAFRRLCRDFGAALTATEMVSAKGLLHGSLKTAALLNIAADETPSCAQLFGADANDFAAALQHNALAHFDIIDINMGCPMPKITKSGGGSALLSNPSAAAGIVEACAKAGRTVTVKVRLGKDNGQNALSFCRMLQNAGAAAIAVHGRTAAQLYTGKADWDAIGTIAAALKIPVIGNGDVLSINEAEEKLSTYPIAGILIGRGALRNPAVFSHTAQPKLKEIILQHIAYSLMYFPARYTLLTLRKHFAYYFKGVLHGKEIKEQWLKASNPDTLMQLIKDTHIA